MSRPKPLYEGVVVGNTRRFRMGCTRIRQADAFARIAGRKKSRARRRAGRADKGMKRAESDRRNEAGSELLEFTKIKNANVALGA